MSALADGNRASKVRQRGTGISTVSEGKIPRSQTSFATTNNRQKPHPAESNGMLRGSSWLVVFAVHALLLLYVYSRSSAFPEPLTENSATAGQFVEERARKNLIDLTGFGSRTVGSHANEELAVDYLIQEIANIQNQMRKDIHDMQIDTQRVSGTFSITFLGAFTSYYENVNNIIVKLSPKGGAKHSLLINCHYDSVMNTTGASDDAVSCCIMLEVLRVMSRSVKPFQHNIVFLFNGAEENILQASHGFITKHPWANDLKAFVNLEAAGAGGKELLFQAGPDHPWLTYMYAEHAPHPFASIVGQEVFQSGIIPSDTDFRIFRDFGGLPGLDIAYIKNGYVYHTKYDRPEMIPPGCIQRGGENLLAVVGAIADSPYLVNPGQYKHGKVVFFDLLGHFMVIYPARIGTIINTVTCFMVLLRFFLKIFGTGAGLHGIQYVKRFSLSILSVVLSGVLSCISVLLIGLFMDWTGRLMTWYTNTFLIFGLYAAPALAAMLGLVALINKLCYKSKVVSAWDGESVQFDATLAIYTIVLGVMTYYGVGSAVLILIFVLWPLLVRVIAFSVIGINAQSNNPAFLFQHLISVFLPNLIFFYAIYEALCMFVPLMGRSGSEIIPDVFIGQMVAIAVVFLFSYTLSLVFVTRRIKGILSFLAFVFLISLVASQFTWLGFPYKADENSPTKQRVIIHHIERINHDLHGQEIKRDSGILHIPFDRVGISHLRDIPALGLQNVTENACEDLPYCGWPYYFPLIAEIRDIYYLQIPVSPDVSPRAELLVMKRSQISPQVQRITMSISGPDHINVYLNPNNGVRLVHWSAGDGVPNPSDMAPGGSSQPHYFIFYSYGRKPKFPWILDIDVEINIHYESAAQLAVKREPERNIDETKVLGIKQFDPKLPREDGLIKVALGAHYLSKDGKEVTTPELDRYVKSLPDWTTYIAWVATYHSWVL